MVGGGRDENEGLLREVAALRIQVAELQRVAARHEETDGVSLAEREELLHEVERVAHLGSWMWDLGTNRVTWSDELYRIMGLEPGSVPASVERYFEALHPEDRVRAQGNVQPGIEHGMLPPFDGRLIRPDGAIRFTTSYSSSLFDKEGNLRRLVGAVLDRTESLEKEAQLRRALELLEEAQRLAHVGNYWHVPETGQSEWSPEFRRIIGAEPDEKATLPGFFERVVPEDRSAFEEIYERLRTEPQGGVVEGRILRPNGEMRHVRVTSETFKMPSGHLEIRGAILDTTDEVKLREELSQAQKMEAIGRLSAGIAHDFNNLLTVVSGNLDLLQIQVGSSAEIEDSLRALESARQLTARLLAFGRKARLSLRVIDPNELVEATLTLLRRLVGDQVRLETELAPHLPPIQVDPLEIERAVVNLVINAREVVGEGGFVKVTTASRSEDGRTWVEIGVEDDGPGISERDRPHVFEPFYTTRHEMGGTGLGLATVLGTAAQHGGTARFEPRDGSGSKFTIVLPASNEPTTEAPFSLPQASSDGTALWRVLVIDDEATVAEVTRRMLLACGHRVEVATTPDGALAVWEKNRGEFDLIVCDIAMPGMKGPKLIERFIEKGPSPRVLFITGYSDRATDNTGGYPILAKPFSVSDLMAAMKLALR